jgi:hypothetical protein
MATPQMEKRAAPQSGCVLIGATGDGVTVDGKALIGSVSDDPYDIRTVVRTITPGDGSHAHIGTELVSLTDETLLERGYLCSPHETTRGVNEAGVAFTMAAVFEVDAWLDGDRQLLFAELTDAVLGKAETVRDAIALLVEDRARNYAWNVLLADAEGALALVEIGRSGVAVDRSYSAGESGAIVAVNCFTTLAHRNEPHTQPESSANNNGLRQTRAVDLLRRSRTLDVHSFACVLSDHANGDLEPAANPVLPGWGFSICNHGTLAEPHPGKDEPWGTVSAEILEPAARRLWYAYGWVCGGTPGYGDQLGQGQSWGRFLPFELDPSAPGPLTTPYGDVTAEGVRALQSELVTPAPEPVG